MKTVLRRIFTCAVLVFLCGSAMAQSREVSGTVTDAEMKEPLPGVSVAIVGKGAVAVTDVDGNYRVKVNGNETLQFTYIGYETQSASVKGRSTINVVLSSKANQLNEMVVVGYQTLKKHDVLGAVSKVGNEELTAMPLASAEQALQGRVAGVSVSSATGSPGADIQVRVRGVGSIYSDNAPLYIVDGVPSANGINNLSPNDIENITVLKDASSAAIYGSRATNGVILVTTKHGKTGQAQISYNGSVGVQQAVNLIDMCNTSEYVNLYNEAATTDNLKLSTFLQRPLITDDVIGKLADVDHIGEIFAPAVLTSHELSVSGGSENTTYHVSGSYYYQDGIIQNSGYNRGTISANVNSKAKKWLELGANFNGSISNRKAVSDSGDGYSNDLGGSIVRYALFRNPAIPVYKADGTYVDKPTGYFGSGSWDTWFGDGYSPEGLSEYTDREINTKTAFTTLRARIILPKDFSINNNFGVDYRDYTQKVYNTCWGDDNRINNPNSLTVANTRNLNWTYNFTLNYNHIFNEKHTLNAVAGFEANREHAEYMNLSDQNFEIWDKDLIYIGNGTPTSSTKTTNVTGSTSENSSTLASFFAQANYDFDQRYYANLTLREDGSSRFMKDNRWGTFWSGSLGWDITREKFMQNQQVLSLLKLRVGYGAIGNQNVGLYAYSSRYGKDYNYYLGTGAASGYAQTQLGNKELKWETSKQANVGLDFSFLKGALAFSVDFYNKTTDNMLMQASYPLSAGTASSPWINSGKVLNRGVDWEIIYRLNRRDWHFEAAFNGGWLHNEVLELDAPIVGGRVDNGIYATQTAVGHPIGAFYMYKMEGIFQNQAEILTSAYQGSGIEPGDVKFKDVDGNNVIDSNDREYCGSAIPKVTLGLNLSVQYKGWDLTAFFQGAYGQKIYNQVNTDIEGFYRGFNVTQRYYDNRWTVDNPSNEYPRASWTAKSNNARVSTRFLENGSYTRLKNLQLGYTFRTNHMHISNLRVYGQVTNLFTITKYSGFDPEMTVSANSTSEADRANGIDWGTYPCSRTYTVGVNLTF